VKETISTTTRPHYIDWEQVNLLVGDNDILPDEIRGVYSDFHLDASNRVEEFHESLELMEPEVLAKNAHYLKMAARSLGFVDFANRLGHIEHLHRKPTDLEWERMMTQLERCLAESFEVLQERYPALAS
jgi:hypothetical protein